MPGSTRPRARRSWRSRTRLATRTATTRRAPTRRINPMKKTTSAIDLYAFWRYDSFPFVLGGPVTRMDEEGRVETENYGAGNWFTPARLLPRAAGEKLHGELKLLEAQHGEARKKFDAE